MKQANALSIEQAIQLMPAEFHPVIIQSGRKRIVKTQKGMAAFHQSSILKGGMWKTSHNEDEIRDEIDYVIFALGFDGILVLPKDEILSFLDNNYSSRYSNNGVPIHIYLEGGRFIWKGKADNTKDVSDYAYPYTNSRGAECSWSDMSERTRRQWKLQ